MTVRAEKVYVQKTQVERMEMAAEPIYFVHS